MDTRILAWCNDVRKELGRKPVRALRKGSPRDPQLCAIGATINFGARNLVYVDSDNVELDTGGGDMKLVANTPPVVRTFIQEFDLDERPEFEGAGWAE